MENLPPSEAVLKGTAKAPFICFEAFYDWLMKGINTTTFRPLITPFVAVVKGERKTSFSSQWTSNLPYVSPLNFVTFYDQKKVPRSTFGGRG